MKKDKKYTGVYQDKNGTYYYKFNTYSLDKVKINKTKRGFASARLAYEAKLIEKNRVEGLVAHAVKANTTQFVGLIEGFVERLRSNGIKESTINGYMSSYNNLIIPFFNQYNIEDITVNSIQAFKNKLMNLNISPSSKRVYLSRLKMFLQHLHLFNYLSNEKINSFLVILQPPRSRTQISGCKGIYTKEDFDLFVSYLTYPKYILIAYMLFNTGCRIGELLATQVKDYDFENQTMLLSKTFSNRVRIDKVSQGLKTQDSRVVKLIQSDVTRIQKYIEDNNLNENDYLFKSSNDLPTCPSHIRISFKETMGKAGLHEIRLHDFRHSHVCYLLDKGVSDKAVADRVGHKNPLMTRVVYDQLTKKKRIELDLVLAELGD